MKTLILAAAAAIALAPVAAAPAHAYRAPSGQELHQTKCKSDPSACYDEASQACQGPYQIIDSNSHAGGIFADLFPGPVTWYGITYVCGRSDGRLAAFLWRGSKAHEPGVITTTCGPDGNAVTCRTY